ncbi:metal ABC transporter solute-binding protein, Zn/Mn family [Saccharomonospora glauca]|uniref:ABC-type metal ion transport system, periplasmic component/surface adhesin n=1 Tax=Saccharomonospora glauca K62 TaxID=928724 RepID=I1D741_9PSEU|nr:zinc ABC transporter substrate-binding protein [Saccharomonospora glauca]EIF00766.1 ABC-type metal ion transport system, periplasmic component/surface adhesin [Saccharomonospora glauca K62]
MHASCRRRSIAGVSLSAVLAVLVAACGGQGEADRGSDDRVRVVASTNVWASVVAAVGGEHVEVTSIIDDPAADPHSYQAGAADAAEVASAELLVWNGGGYDDFFPQLAENADAPTVVAVEVAGETGKDVAAHEHAESVEHGRDHEHSHEHGNEHVWYDLPVVSAVAERVAGELSDLRPQQAGDFEKGAADFTERVDELVNEIDEVAERHAGAKVAATEPLAQYLLSAVEVTDLTPHEFSAAVENETDVPVAAQQRMLELVSGEVDAVVRNTQTTTPATEKVVEAAREAGTPVVDVTETLPEGRTDYISWMGAQVDALAKALDE